MEDIYGNAKIVNKKLRENQKWWQAKVANDISAGFLKYRTDIHQMHGKDFFIFLETYVYGTVFSDPLQPVEGYPYIFTGVTTRWHPKKNNILQEDPVVLVNLDATKSNIEIPWNLVRYAFEDRFPRRNLIPRYNRQSGIHFHGTRDYY